MRDRATSNVLVEDSLKKSREEFVRVEPDCCVNVSSGAKRSQTNSSRAELIVPCGAQWASHCGKKVRKKRTTIDDDALRYPELCLS